MKTEKQKQKILYIEEYLRNHSDEKHPVTTAQILQYLHENGIEAERKSIYHDIDTLIDFGLDIIKCGGNKGGCYLASREFELPEVKLLVDLVQSSSFITEKKSQELIKKLEKLVPHQDAVTLQRQVVVADRNKTINETIYYTVDAIYEAMQNNKKLTFLYYEWDENKKQKLRKDGKPYEVSPWLLTWDDERYYLIAYDSEAQIMKHYRVDKMLSPKIGKDARDGREAYEAIDIASYSKKTFGMFSGEEKTVRMEFDRELSGVVVDRFGTDVAMRVQDEKSIVVRTDVTVSPKFFGWLCGFGDRVRILSPESVKDAYRIYLEQILRGME